MTSAASQIAPQRPVFDSVAVSRIKTVDLSLLQSVLLTGKRCKKVYLFDSVGRSTISRSHATYMVDSSMTPIELGNWDMVKGWRIRVPTIYGKTDNGFPIVEWLPQQVTVGGGGRFHVFAELKNVVQPASLNCYSGGPQREKWRRTLTDIRHLLKLGYSSPDFQFMISPDGSVYIMDLEQNNTPTRVPGRQDPRLVSLEHFLAGNFEPRHEPLHE